MTRLVLTTVVFALAAGVNTASVAVQQETAVFTRRCGAKAWYVHLAVITPGWVAFLFLVAGVSRHFRWALPGLLRPAGVALVLVAAVLWLIAAIQLGPERIANGYFFGRGPRTGLSTGIFRWLRNPVYDSYALAFFGVGLLSANGVYLLLAAESYLLCNLVEARVENRPFRRIPAGGGRSRRRPRDIGA
jgi:protein-S-isoprenylcysteine O-methyltransferase Ste14